MRLFFTFFLFSFQLLLRAQPSTTDSIMLLKDLRYAPPVTGLYQSDSSSDHLLDLYLPARSTQPTPVILFIHGGGFSGGDKQGTAIICRRIAGCGFAVASINYQLYLKHHRISGASAGANMAAGLPPGGRFHEGLRKAIQTAAADAFLALSWIQEKAAHYNLNAEFLAIAGGSAGAMTALYTAYIDKRTAGQIKAVINLWGGLEDARLIHSPAPPLLTFHGSADTLINKAYAIALHNRMQAIGNHQSLLQLIDGKGHAIYNYIANEKTDVITAFLKPIFNTLIQ